MKKQSELNKLVEETKKREKTKKEKVDIKWLITIIIVAFIISFGSDDASLFAVSSTTS